MQNENQKQALPSAYEIASVATMLMGKLDPPSHPLQEALRLLMQAGRLRQRVESHLRIPIPNRAEGFHKAFLDAGQSLDDALAVGASMGEQVPYAEALQQIGVRTDKGLRAILKHYGTGSTGQEEATPDIVESQIARYKKDGLTRYQINQMKQDRHRIKSDTGRANRLSKTKPKGRRKAVK